MGDYMTTVVTTSVFLQNDSAQIVLGIFFKWL
jgi:hypothetical protein